MAFPIDTSNQPVVGGGSPEPAPQSNPASLESAVNAIVDAVTRAKTACVVPGILLARAGLRREATALIDASGLPFAAMFMDKATLDEAHPNYIGMYDGRLMEESVRAFVEGADCVIGLGALWSDFSSGAFTATLDRSKTINVFHHSTRVGDTFYEDVEMKDVLEALAAGKALVASPLAIAGLELVSGREVLVADGDDELCRAIDRLLQDPELRVAVARRARAWGCAHLGVEKSVAAYDRLYRRLLAERKGS